MSRPTLAPSVRPMVEADIPQAALVSAEAFEIDLGTPGAESNWHRRLLHSLDSDRDGSFVSEHGGVVTGVAQAVVREDLWILSILAASPTLGVGGEGRALVDATLGYGSGCAAGIIIASDDPRALRIYGSSGFALEPTFKVTGTVDPRLLPDPHPEIVAVSPERFETLASIARAVRGAPHTRDLAVALQRGASVFSLPDRGYVVTMPGRGVWALAAGDERSAAELLWHGLRQLRDEPRLQIGWITARQRWALDVVLAARLSLTTYGAIATRGAPGPLHPYIPSPSFA